MSRRLAFVTYETPFARCGGIQAVMGKLPGAVSQATGQPVVVVTPYHGRIQSPLYRTASSLKAEDKLQALGSVSVAWDHRTIEVAVYRFDDPQRWPWYFLEAGDPDLFAGLQHPYDVSSGDLLRDARLFGAAAPRALQQIDPEARWTLLLQDWEAATAASAVRELGLDWDLFLTMHNSYDHAELDSTVLKREIPLLNWPVFTVSEQFALDMNEDPLQTEVMADHIQRELIPRLVGVDNGPFESLRVDESVLEAAKAGDSGPLREWKRGQRDRALEALRAHQPSEDRPIWGDVERFCEAAGRGFPWFVFAGRDDTRQKGYDAAAAAVIEFLKMGGEAQFLFFPLPGDEGLSGLGFLERAASEHPDELIALPFFWQEGYFAALRGAAYGVMPSFYEPFGMASDFYLNGSAGIGRATGGLIQQVVPLRRIQSFTAAVEARSVRWHSASAAPTGILYRESDDIPTKVRDWRAINAADYLRTGEHRRGQRMRFPLFVAMASGLLLAIVDGCRIYRGRPDLYFRMVVDGIDHIQRTFSWERAGREYACNL